MYRIYFYKNGRQKYSVDNSFTKPNRVSVDFSGGISIFWEVYIKMYQLIKISLFLLQIVDGKILTHKV